MARLINFELVEIDLFDRSNFAWTDVSAGQDGACVVATGLDSWAVVLRHGEHWAAIGGLQPKDGERSASVIAVGDRSVCLARADDWVNEHEPADQAHRSQAWTKRQPTEKQMTYLRALASRRDLTRYAAACHLTKRFNRKLIGVALAGAAGELAA